MGIEMSWKYRAFSLVADALGVLCLLSVAGTAVENPGDPTDVSGLPAISMYVVILLGLLCLAGVLFVLCVIARGFAVGRFADRLIFYFWASLMLLSGVVGGFVSIAYFDGLTSFLAIMLFVLSIYWLALSFRKARASL
ncbi:hypothetical protein [Pseudomonas asiatica]|uniref:hypothetical protein n=1 Tax=Pseudomonas asiatica TaxID=2219225 RepID=UPI00399A6382